MKHVVISEQGIEIVNNLSPLEVELRQSGDGNDVHEVPDEVGTLIEHILNTNRTLAQHAVGVSEKVQENLLPLLTKAWGEGYEKAEKDHGETGFYSEKLRDDPYRAIMKQKAEMLLGGTDGDN